MPFTAAMRNTMLDVLGTGVNGAFGSLHSAFSATGLLELTGGAPAYARMPLTWQAAAAGVKSIVTPGPIFNVAGGSTVAFLGFWSLVTGGVFQGMFPVGGTGYKEVQTSITGAPTLADSIISEGHGFVNGDRVVFLNGTAPGALVIGTIYFVVNAAANSFQVAATSGGTPLAFATAASAACVVSKIVPEVYAGQGTYQANSFDYSMP